ATAMNRRDFLHPQQLTRNAGQLMSLLRDRPAESQPHRPECALLRFARQAMATTFEVLLPFATPHASETAAAALDEIDRLEDQLSVFRDHSEVSNLNRRAFYEPVPVEERLFELISLAGRLNAET